MTTLPSFLFNSHKRYKEDTNRVATWLVETAQKYGHPLKGQPPSSRPSGRLKGKDRKKAREAEKAGGAETIIPPIRYTITVKEFTDLADWIANLKPPVKVPRLILSLIRSAITLRRRCADWFQTKGAKEEDNLNHSYFIDVLERVLGILEPKSVSESTGSVQEGMHTQNMNDGAKSETELDRLTNIYDVLSIDENDDSTITPATATAAQNAASRQTTPRPSRKTIYEIETTDEELFFAFFCFFDDMNQLRKFLLTLWLRYKDRSLDLITVSATTNTAINLVRRVEQDFLAMAPILGSTEELLKKFQAVMSENNPRTRERLDDIIDPVKPDISDWLFMPAQAALHAFCEGIREYGLELKQSALYGQHVDGTMLTSYERSEQDVIVLQEALIEFLFMTKIDSTPVLDEITYGLASMVADKNYPLWMSFAGQIFLDIHNALGEDVGRGLSELQASGTHIASVLKECYDSSKSGTFAPLPASMEPVFDS